MWPVGIANCVFICDSFYSKHEILQMEYAILKHLRPSNDRDRSCLPSEIPEGRSRRHENSSAVLLYSRWHSSKL
ncbi:hypothetical protein ACHAXR_007550 [Thalassiosira sp. AJA248-18]